MSPLSCSTCSSTFSSQATLYHHKLKKGHNKHEIATASTPKKKRQRKTKQCTINEMLRSHQNNTNDGNSDEEENACSSTNCQINSANNAVINWVGCESCGLWFHSMCVGLGDRSERELEQIYYKCEVF